VEDAEHLRHERGMIARTRTVEERVAILAEREERLRHRRSGAGAACEDE
jgi:hypothetical protein